MPLRNRAQRTRVGSLQLLLEQSSRIVQQTHLRLQTGDLDFENRATRTLADLEQLSTQLRRASRGQNLTADLAQSLSTASDLVQDLVRAIRQRTQHLSANGGLQASTIGFQSDVLRSGSRGRPNIDIRRTQLEFLLSLGFTPTTMARENVFGRNVHRNTIQNRMHQWGLRCNNFAHTTDDEIDQLVRQLNQQYPNSGYREMTQLLRERHDLALPRYRVMESLRRIDPVGAAGRWALVVTRRTYTATSANSCWHIDTNHGLIKWKIVIQGCIDGLSRLIPYLFASDNNSAKTNLFCFLTGIKQFGLPSRVRGDHGEHLRAALGLPASAVKYTAYNRLVRSLQSGLPNEVDFSINVCMLLSHPGPKFLRLASVPPIVELLLAHAGIFSDGCPSPAVKQPAAPVSPAPSGASAAQHPTVQKILMNRTAAPARLHSPPVAPVSQAAAAQNSPRPSSRDSSASGGLASKHPTLANKLLIGSNAPNSFGTPEDSLSGPPSPESLVSGVGTESPGPNSPRSVRSTGAELILPANCHLEVCEKAQEAKNLIETGENHEAKIIRIENTTAVAKEPVKMNGEHIEEPMERNKKKEFLEDSLNDERMKDIFAAAIKAAANGEKQYLNGKIEIRKDQVVAVMQEQLEMSKNNDGRMQTGSENLAEELLKNSRRSTSPSPNLESVSENLTACQKSIQELLEVGEKEKKKMVEKLESSNLEKELGNLSAATRPVGEIGEELKTNGQEETGEAGEKKKIGRPKKGQEKTGKSPKKPKEPKDTTKTRGKRKRQSTDSGGPEAKMPTPSPTPSLGVAGGQRWAPPPQNLRYMCEWNGCGRTFLKASAVYYHAATVHISDTTIQCKWPHCDKTIRLKWSMTTHVQDVHCSEMALKSAALRRYELSVTGQSNIPEPQSPPPHPGYSNHASIDAIRRHAFNNVAKDLTEENEGPVTKSIRLTSCLILRNLARYSSEGRRILKTRECHLAWLALSQLESAAALGQCLSELNSPPSSPSQQELNLHEADKQHDKL